MKKIIRAIASLIILSPIPFAIAFLFSLVGEMLNRLSNGQNIEPGSILWLVVGSVFVVQLFRFVWEGWREQPQPDTSKSELPNELQPPQRSRFKWEDFLKRTFKFLFIVFVVTPIAISLTLTLGNWASQLFGPESIPFILIAIPLVIWLGAKPMRALKANLEEKRQALAENKWQGGSKRTTRLEIGIRVILLLVLIPPLLIALQGAVLSFANFNNPLFRSAISPDDVVGQGIMTFISLIIFMPFLLIFVGLCWLAYKLASRLARVITYIIGIQTEYKRLEEAMTTPTMTQEDELDELPKEQQTQYEC